MLLLARNLVRSYSISSPRYAKMPTNTATRDNTVARRIARRRRCTNWTIRELTANARFVVWMFSGRQRSMIDKSGGGGNAAHRPPNGETRPPNSTQSLHQRHPVHQHK